MANKKENYFKSGKLERKHQQKHQDAEVRQKKHSGHFGTKEKVKKGIITPCEGLAVLNGESKTKTWLTKKKNLIGC